MTDRPRLTLVAVAGVSATLVALGVTTAFAADHQDPDAARGEVSASRDVSVRAYGTFGADGRLREARSQGATVSKLSGRDGAYCVEPRRGSGINPARTSIVVSAIRAGTPTVTAMSTPQPISCAKGWLVTTQEELATGLFRSEDVGVTFVIP